MSTFVVGECTLENIFQRWDADAASEAQFEYIVAKALACVYPQYNCIVFGGSFRRDGEVSRPDLALIAKDYSHWFIVEVELVTHSLNGHVLPQIRAFQFGEPLSDCVSILAKETGLSQSRMRTFLEVVPRSVAVVANKRSQDWDLALASLQVQMLTVSVYKSAAGIEAVEVEGQLDVLKEHLGFGVFYAADRSLRFPSLVKLLDGEIMISDRDGMSGLWTVKRAGSFAWVTKNAGAPDIHDGSHVQLIRSYGGRISLRQ